MWSDSNANMGVLLRRYRKTLRRLIRIENNEEQQRNSTAKRIRCLFKRMSQLERRIGLLRFGKIVDSSPRTALCAAVLSAAAMITPQGLFAQAPKIVALSPSTNALAAPRNTGITIDFDRSMDVTTLTTATTTTAANLVVYGSQTGYISADAALFYRNNNKQVVLRPTGMFKPGERVDVTVRAAQSSTGATMANYTVFQFNAAVASGGAPDFKSVNFGHGANNSNSREVAIGDLDGDGDLDVVVGNFGQQDEVWLNDGAGNFTTSELAVACCSDERKTRGLGLADMDGDGDLDIVTGGWQRQNRIFFNNGDGTFTSSYFGRYNSENTGVSIGDIDGDGDLDVIMYSENLDYDDFFFNNGDGTFNNVTYQRTRFQNQTRLADYDHDGDLELGIVGRLWTSHRLSNNGDGTFSGQNIGGPTFNNGGFYSLKFADINGDSFIETSFVNYRHGFADLDGDGDLDMLSSESGCRLSINDGTGNFSTSSVGGASFLALDFGDLDGDGDLDAVLVRDGANRILFNQSVVQLASVTPAANENAAPRDSNVELEFNSTMNTVSVSPLNTSVFLHGSQSGRVLSAPATFDGTDRVLTFNPADDFLPGEFISVSSTGGQSQAGVELANPVVSGFRVASVGGSAEFTADELGAAENFLAGDFDGDHIAETLLIEQNNIHLLNVGSDGTWQKDALGIAPGADAHAIAADFDGDGDLDVVVDVIGSNLMLLENNGSASFTTSTFGPLMPLLDAAVGDLDGDGDLDLLVGSLTELRLFRNNGDATFAESSLATGRYQSVKIGDLDKDGNLDVVSARRDFPNPQPLEIRLGDGNGGFDEFEIASGRYFEVELADFNDDGLLDIVAGTDSGAQSELFLNQGNAVFAQSLIGNTGNGSSVDTGDYDGDGDLDILILANANPDLLLLNNGDATFSSSSPQDFGMVAMRSADLDGDGDLDLVAGDGSTGKLFLNDNPLPRVISMSPARNSFNGGVDDDIELTWRERTLVDQLEQTTTAAIQNLTVQGMQSGLRWTTAGLSANTTNLVVAIDPGIEFFPGEKVVISAREAVNNINQTQIPQVLSYTAAVPEGTGGYYPLALGSGMSNDVALGDLNGDYLLDAIVVNEGGTSSIWLGQGDGTFNQNSYGPDEYRAVKLGDLDGDGDLDAALASSGSAMAEVWMNNGDGTFVATQFGLNQGRSTTRVAVNDLDGDGDLDVLWTSSSGLLLGRNNGGGIPAVAPFINGAAEFVALVDLNGDDAVDIFVGHGSGGSTIHLNNNDNTFTEQNLDNREAGEVAAADVNGDGFVDLLVASKSQLNEPTVEILLNDGNAAFTTSASVVAGAVNGIVVGDINADGFPDAVIATDNADEFWLNNGNGTFKRRVRGSGVSRGADLGDIDSDGALEVIVARDGAERIWQNLDEPTISAFAPAAATVTTASISFDARGHHVYITAANIATVNQLGNSTGTTSLTINSVGLTSSSLQIPAGLGVNAAVLPVTLFTDAGHTRANFTLNNDQPRIATNQTLHVGTEDTPLLLTLKVKDVWPGIGALNLTLPVTDGSTIASIVQSGATSANTQFIITPALDANFNNVPLTFSVDDGELTHSTTVLVSFLPVNDAPLLAAADLLATDEDQATSLTFSLFDVDNAFNQIAVSVTSSDQTLVSNAGLVLSATAASMQVEVNPVPNANGTALVTISAFDGQATVSTTFTLNVNPVNDPPLLTLVNPQLTTDEDVSTNATILLSDIDTPFSHLLLSATSANQSLLSGGGIILGATGATTNMEVIPELNANGAAIITVSVVDGVYTRTTSLTLTVNPVNDPPVIRAYASLVTTDEDTATTAVLQLTDVDTPFNMLVLTATSASQALIASSGIVAGTLSATTNVVLQPAADAHGATTLEFFLNDGEFTRSTTILLSVLPVNDPPMLSAPLTLTNKENQQTSAVISIIDVDKDYSGMLLSATSNNQSLFTDVNLTLASPASSVQFQAVPVCGATGSATVTIRVVDGIYEVATTISIQVDPVADLSITGSTCGCPNMLLTYSALPEDNTATHLWSIVGGQIVSGQGSDQVQVIWDQGGTSAVLSVSRNTLTGCNLSEQLIITPKTVLTAMDYLLVTNSSASVNVLNNDLGSSASLLFVDEPQHGQATFLGAVVTYVPDAGFSGSEVFNYTMRTAGLCLATGAVVVVVPADEELPVNAGMLQLQRNRVGDIRGLENVCSAVVSPDGRFVYAAGRNEHSIVIFQRNPVDGTLNYLSRVRDQRAGIVGLKYPSDLAIDPSGAFLYAAGYGDNALVVFRRDKTNGDLTFVVRKKKGQADGELTINGMKRPRSVDVSMDGRTVVLSGHDDNSIAIFRKDDLTDEVSFVGYFKDGLDGVDGLRQALGLALSFDGKHVYISGMADDAIALFRRNAITGELTYVTRYKNGQAGIDGIDGACDVAVSSDGRHVYAAGYYDDAVVMFNRNAADGTLSFGAKYSNGSIGISGLNGVSGVNLSPDGAQLWAAGQIDNSVVLFNRNPMSGALDLAGVYTDGINGYDGLAGAGMAAISPDGAFAYVPGSAEDAVAVLQRNHKPLAVSDAAGAVAANNVKVLMPLGNDSDPDGDLLTISNALNGSFGTVALSGGGTTIDYSAGAVTGLDQIQYTVSDGHGGESTATITISVVQPKQSQTDLANVDRTPLLGVTPNPLRSGEEVRIDVGTGAAVSFAIHDLAGRRIAGFAQAASPTGIQQIRWTAVERDGALLPAGVYILLVEFRDNAGRDQVIESKLVIQR